MGEWGRVTPAMGAFCALVVAVLLVSDPALAASRFRRNDEGLGENCKELKLRSETCIEDAHAEFTKSMENEKAPESDVCTNKVCDYLKAIEECYTHLDSCENEDENKKEKFQDIILNGDCKSLNIEVCPIMKTFMDDNPVIAKTLEGECDYNCEMEQDTIDAIEAGNQDDANEGNQDGDAAPEGNTEDVQSSNEGEGAKSEDVHGKAGEDDTDDNDQNNENDGDDVDDDHDTNGDGGHEDDGDKDTDERNKAGNKNADEENNVKEKKEKNADEVNNFKEKKKEKNNNDKGNSGKDTIILSTSLLFITLIFSFYLPE